MITHSVDFNIRRLDTLDSFLFFGFLGVFFLVF